MSKWVGICPRYYFIGVEQRQSLCSSLKHWGGSRCGPNGPSLKNFDSVMNSSEKIPNFRVRGVVFLSSYNKFLRDAPELQTMNSISTTYYY